MSTKHFFPDPTGLVQRALKSLVARNPHLQFDEPNRVVFSKTHEPSRVSIISGGGSGHEPAWSGFVGDGMLSAGVSGDVFASPSTKQVMAGIENVPSDAGVILCITNYTGDRLHFGLAREKAHAKGMKIAQIPLSDDVALPRGKVENLGRRGLAGNMIVLKLLGAAAQDWWSFEDCFKLGTETNAQLATIGTSLDHCHVMGRTQHETIPEDACVLGMGIHNEPGLRTITPMPSPEELIKEMLLYILDPKDSERNYVSFKPKDTTCLLVNNFGGLSPLELDGLAQVALEQLSRDYSINPVRIYVSTFETSLNGPGFSLTLGNLSGIASSTSHPLSTITNLLDAPTTAPAWPRNHYGTPVKESSESASRRSAARFGASTSTETTSPAAPAAFLPALRAACETAIKAEPDITQYDMQLGDGDCGEGVVTACSALLARFSQAPFTTSPIPLFPALDAITETLEDSGGSLFAILSILATAFVGNVKRGAAQNGNQVSKEVVAEAAGAAVKSLFAYTGARVGDRTCMDTLIPFCESLQLSDGNGVEALDAAQKGAASTAAMKPRFGRATYVGKDLGGEMPPDAGAYAVATWLAGFVNAWKFEE